jgi:hypothetical protein
MYTVQLPTGGNPIAANKNINIKEAEKISLRTTILEEALVKL